MNKKIIDIIKSRENLVHDAAEEFIRAMDKAQNYLLDLIIDSLKELKTSRGKIKSISENIKEAIRLRREIKEFLRDAGYYEALTDFGKKYDQLIELIDQYGRIGFKQKSFLDVDLEILSQVKKSDIYSLGAVDEVVSKTIYDEVMASIYKNESWRGLTDKLKEIMTDTELPDGRKLRGLIKKYGETYANTAFSAFDRRATQIQAKNIKAEKFLYSGGLLAESREFCQERAGKIFTREQIDKWNSLDWKGKVRGRDVWIFLGGYNCQHILTPVTNEMIEYLSDEKLILPTQ